MAEVSIPTGDQQTQVSIPTRDERSLGRLVSSASQDVSALIRSEIELAKLEIRADVRRAAAGGGMLGAAGAFGAYGLLLALVAAALGVHALGITLGWSFLIIAGGCLLLAMIFGLIALLAMRRVAPPRRAIRAAKESADYFKGRRTTVA